MNVDTDLNQQGFACANEPLASGQGGEIDRTLHLSSATGGARLLGDIRLYPDPREHTLENLCGLEFLRQICPARHKLFDVRDRDDQTAWRLGVRKVFRIPCRFGRRSIGR